MAADILRRAGLTVHGATDGREAIARLRARVAEIRAVVLDLTMPGMSGEETFKELHRIAPDLPVVLVSGYDEEHAARRFGDLRPSGFLQKPFLPSALLTAVRGVLEPKPAAGD
jgi:DNA-binding NtrC family response regulator